MTEYQVPLIGGGDDEVALVVLSHAAGECRFEFRYRDRVLNAIASDFFEAFCRIRLDLEKEKLIPFCYGASVNVYPSGMGRDMGLGLKAYKMTPGKHAQLGDSVEIFGEGPDIIPAYFDVQKKYFQDWLNSARK